MSFVKSIDSNNCHNLILQEYIKVNNDNNDYINDDDYDDIDNLIDNESNLL